MKTILTFLIFINFFTENIYSQAPLVKQWDHRYGGLGSDYFHTIEYTRDKGYIIGGFTGSDSSGNMSQHTWGTGDYWVVKVDSLGILQWDKRFGGTNLDEFATVLQTSDNGYILGGGSYSNISGDKTQANWGQEDYWIVKIDSSGNKQWDRRYGGTMSDELFSICLTDDGGYLLGGSSNSSISGDKTESCWGQDDYWIVKIDSIGNKQWDKRFGGSRGDYFKTAKKTNDGGFILTGFSYSDISGDKTQNNFGSVFTSTDYWVVKIDSIGNKQWDKTFGGSRYENSLDILVLNNDGYIVGGETNSSANGSISQPNWDTINSLPTSDMWILKIDCQGNKIWDKRYGGNSNEELLHMIELCDKGFILSGDSYSNISGNKTENNMGLEQTWLLRIDSVGNVIWDKTILTDAGIEHDESGMAILADNGCYAIANYTKADSGAYKTENGWGDNDYWLIKFFDSTFIQCDTSIIQCSNLGLESLKSGNDINIYPNPVSDIVTIQFHNTTHTNITFTIKNVLGQTMFEEKNISSSINSKTIDLSFLSKGIYFVDINVADVHTVKKIVKQ